MRFLIDADLPRPTADLVAASGMRPRMYATSASAERRTIVLQHTLRVMVFVC